MIRRERGGKLEAVSGMKRWITSPRASAPSRLVWPGCDSDHRLLTRNGNETNYVMQKFARAVIGTNNVDAALASDTAHRLQVCTSRSVTAQ